MYCCYLEHLYLVFVFLDFLRQSLSSLELDLARLVGQPTPGSLLYTFTPGCPYSKF